MKKSFLFLLTFLLFFSPLFAHTVNYELEGKPLEYVFSYYLQLGFQHILPLGLDHILFVVGLYLLSPKLKDVLLQATTFTIAHTITLGLVMKNMIVAPSNIIEPIIALSIAFIALENLITSKLGVWRILIVFFFGLVHGMGFASALSELGLPRDSFYVSLLTFNVGVELGQISVIVLCWLAFGLWFSSKQWYKSRIVIPFSLSIAAIALYWTVERTLF